MESPPTQEEVAAPKMNDEWVTRYTTRKARDMAAKALALPSRRR
jgi:hypothetical protein